jgi:hypothetical protein
MSTVIDVKSEDPRKDIGPVMWMPKSEYDAWQKLKAEMTEEAWKQHCYFFWNNFSMDGYDEWKLKQVKNEETTKDNS